MARLDGSGSQLPGLATAGLDAAVYPRRSLLDPLPPASTPPSTLARVFTSSRLPFPGLHDVVTVENASVSPLFH